jgi:hypothetical protein
MDGKTKLVSIKSYVDRITTSGHDSFNNFINRERLNWYVFETYEKNTTVSEPLKNHLRKLVLVHLVSIIEVFLKEVIIDYSEMWSKKGVEELLNDKENKFTLSESYDLFGKSDRQITPAHLISHFASFQNIASIDKVFSPLTGTKFFNAIIKFNIVLHEFSPELSFAELKIDLTKALSEIYELRHKIVHECEPGELSKERIIQYQKVIYIFATTLIDYLDTREDLNEYTK